MGGDDDDTVVLERVAAEYAEPLWRRFGGGGRRSRRTGPRRSATLGAIAAVLLVFIGLFGAGAGLGMVSGAPGLPPADLARPAPSGKPSVPAMARSTPVRIQIPAIGVSAPIMSVGLAADGTIGTPPLANSNLAGWYSGGPAPGENGPAIVVGHVDGPHGESIFYKIDKLKPGETVTFNLANHKTAVFSIYSVEYYAKGNFPGDKIYGDYSRPGLRLITCGGSFLGGSTGYSDNVVVYATLKK